MKLNATQLKIIALILMTFEHATYIFADSIPSYVTIGAKIFGRVVAPTFIFLALESFYHTSNRMRYVFRLVLAALIMQLGNFILGTLLHTSVSLNIFASLAVGVIFIWSLDSALKTEQLLNKIVLSFGVVFSFVAALFCEGSFMIPFTFLIFYVWRNNKILLNIVFVLYSLTFLFPPLQLGLASYITFPYQWAMFLTLLFINSYNGQKGSGLKYLFYTYYPLHAWFLYFLRFVTR